MLPCAGQARAGRAPPLGHPHRPRGWHVRVCGLSARLAVFVCFVCEEPALVNVCVSCVISEGEGAQVLTAPNAGLDGVHMMHCCASLLPGLEEPALRLTNGDGKVFGVFMSGWPLLHLCIWGGRVVNMDRLLLGEAGGLAVRLAVCS